MRVKQARERRCRPAHADASGPASALYQGYLSFGCVVLAEIAIAASQASSMVQGCSSPQHGHCNRFGSAERLLKVTQSQVTPVAISCPVLGQRVMTMLWLIAAPKAQPAAAAPYTMADHAPTPHLRRTTFEEACERRLLNRDGSVLGLYLSLRSSIAVPSQMQTRATSERIDLSDAMRGR